MTAIERTIPRIDNQAGYGAPSAEAIGRRAERGAEINHLLATARSTVRKVLSTDSEQFMNQVKQQSGQ